MDYINEYMKSTFTPEKPQFEELTNHPELAPSMITVSINGGRKNKISAGDILGALTAKNGIAGSDIGKIDRLDYLTFVAVKRSSAQKALDVLDNGQIKGRKFLARLHD